MSQKLLVLDEVIAMMSVVGIAPDARDRFRKQAESVLDARPTKGVDEVTVSSGFGVKSQRGTVDLTINDERTQMDARKAREVGLMLIEAGEAAASDEMFMRLLDKIGASKDPETRGRFLLELREIRQGTKDTSRPQ